MLGQVLVKRDRVAEIAATEWRRRQDAGFRLVAPAHIRMRNSGANGEVALEIRDYLQITRRNIITSRLFRKQIRTMKTRARC
jgi:hypothetical protein